MDSTTRTSSSLSRYRPVVVTITGFAAAYGVYLLYTTFKPSSGSSLHRSNAVRRRRRNADQPHTLLEDGFDGTGAELLGDTPAADGNHDNLDGAETIDEIDSSWEIPPGDAFTARRQSDGQNLKSLLYYIAEDQARQEGYVHRSVTCNQCEIRPIRGVRWRCMNCVDYDLCSDCEAQNQHDKTHVFYKIRIPAPFLGNPRHAQPVIYTGKPHLMPRELPSPLRKRLMEETQYESAELDALYEQFTCLANSEWSDDPNHLCGAISRTAFDKTFVPYTLNGPPKPNLVYDRMFAYYDSNGDGLIGYEEFIKGLCTLHSRSSSPTAKLQQVFKGYDIDGDGFVSRKDFLRMFRAYYAIQKEIVNDLMAVQDEGLHMLGAMNDTIHSSQPLSSAFTESIPRGDRFRPNQKAPDQFGDLRAPGQSVIREDPEYEVNRAEIIGDAWQRQRNAAAEDSEPVRWSAFMARYGPQLAARDEARNERWRRREFYTDVEEGWVTPRDHEEGGDTSFDTTDGEGSPEIHRTVSTSRDTSTEPHTVSPRSRSSSKVRFQDDPEFDARSHTSTSSRPIGERWGGYEIPEAEKDLGNELLYQVTQQGLNELLDPLFKEKEDLAMEAYATGTERARWRTEITQYTERRSEKEKLDALAASDPLLAIAEAASTTHVVDSNISPPKQPTSPAARSTTDGVGAATEQGTSVLDDAVRSRPLDDLLQASGYSVADGVTIEPPADAPAASEPPSLLSPSTIQADGALHEGSPTPTTTSQSTAGRNLPESQISSETLDQSFTSTYPRLDLTWPQFRPNSMLNLSLSRSLTPSPPSSEPDADDLPECTDELDDGILLPQYANGSPQGPHRAASVSTSTALNGSAVKPSPEAAEAAAATEAEPKTPARAEKRVVEPAQPPDEARLQRFALLDAAEEEIRIRGGAGRLSSAEFVEKMLGPTGQALRFVQEWLEMGSF